MIKVGQFNKLKVIKEVSFGLYLDGEDWGDILLPNKVVPEDTKVNDLLDVFIYFDSDDKIIATTQRPRARLGNCAFLKVIDVNRVGAFLDWGLDKDLLVPVPEQQRPMEQGKSYIVSLKLDNKGRIIASSKLDHCLDKTPINFKRGDEVSLLIAEPTDLGNKVIINDSHWGLIHSGDIFQTLNYGRRIPGYIKMVREDGKVDVVLRKLGHDNIRELAARIHAQLQQNDGFLPLHDKSSSQDIMRAFGDSKKSFKSAIGQLYKEGVIHIEDNGIRLRNKNKNIK
ncbi:CvfB family protein [Legionella bononiensis]|uniref:GntR family transcriptional regulator n=1 Tax=Legionella bononiensis TaxID=2793102 RepID=A0ABS1WDA2_9GAMM|nr:S1-like domain-containing RNA-binding protein [Legionella bononiensis]MBL7481193.1 GntR family transcriptional regulator [Legionella bononiensis]MBL7527299.1 GntR family transcriptional regulator [Legionella bononiensis]MBL7562268.1 GntR family transcriptional regulator [Legionella bononiensis]